MKPNPEILLLLKLQKNKKIDYLLNHLIVTHMINQIKLIKYS